ncbi:MAG: thiamine pyrophosphate-binding protein [Pseudohongiellaceae bacterium]
MTKMTGAQFLADSLDAYGVTHVFFVPAILSHTLAEIDKRTQIKRIVTHGEIAAVYMADGYARASGRVGVAFAQCVGAANLAAGLRDPYLACSPLVVLAGGPYSQSSGRHVYQEIEDFPLFKSVTKYSARVETVTRLPDILRQAFRAATTNSPGPAHIELAGHLGEVEQETAELEVIAEPMFGNVPPFRPAPDMSSTRKVAQVLGSSIRPIIVVGGGARTSRAGAELRALAERLNIPVATSLNAKSLLPGDHPLNVGVVGTYARQSANRAVLAADLVFFIGSHTGSQVTSRWQVPRQGTKVIQLDINAEELGRHYPNSTSLLGDAKLGLRDLIDLSDAGTAKNRQSWVDHVRALAENWRSEVALHYESDLVPIRPERICRDLSRHLPDNTLVVSDTGHSGMWTAAMLDLMRPGQDYIRAAGSLGWGFPAALGAKLALPDRPVLLFSGDGGFWYHLSELETAVRWNINAVLLVNNNKSLNQEIDIFKEAYGGKLERNHGELWKFKDVSFSALAESMGAKGIRVEKPSEIGSALDQAFTSGRPCVVEVMSDINAIAPWGEVTL